MACIEIPDSLHSRFASTTNSLMASIIFLNSAPWTSRAMFVFVWRGGIYMCVLKEISFERDGEILRKQTKDKPI